MATAISLTGPVMVTTATLPMHELSKDLLLKKRGTTDAKLRLILISNMPGKNMFHDEAEARKE